jgi:hypothetical protein
VPEWHELLAGDQLCVCVCHCLLLPLQGDGPIPRGGGGGVVLPRAAQPKLRSSRPTEWCKLSAEHTPDMGGFRQALLTPPTHQHPAPRTTHPLTPTPAPATRPQPPPHPEKQATPTPHQPRPPGTFQRPGALLWAATDSQLPTPNGPNTAGGDLQKRALGFYAKTKAIPQFPTVLPGTTAPVTGYNP